MANQNQTPSAAWHEFMRRSSRPQRASLNLSEKDFTTFETSARKSMMLSSFTEWFMALLSKLVRQQPPDMEKIVGVVSSLGQVLDQVARETSITVANLTLRRRDLELARLPSLFPEDLTLKLRASSFRGNELFNEELVKSATPVTREAASHRQLMALLEEKTGKQRQESRHQSPPRRGPAPKRQSSTSTDRGGKRQRGNNSSYGSSNQQQRGRDRPQQQQQHQQQQWQDRQPQQWQDRQPQQQREQSYNNRGNQPFRPSTSRRGSRGGRGRR